MARKLLDPIPPGEVLLEEFMLPMGISINALARDIDVPPNRISEIINGKRSITADTALRLGKYFGVSPAIWLTCSRTMIFDSPNARIGPKSSRASDPGLLEMSGSLDRIARTTEARVGAIALPLRSGF